MKPDQQRVKELLTEAITMLCKSGLNYKTSFNIEGLLGITLDEDEIFLVNINETVVSQLDTLVHSNVDKLLVNGSTLEASGLSKDLQTIPKIEQVMSQDAVSIGGDHLVQHTYSALPTSAINQPAISSLFVKEEHSSDVSDSETRMPPKHRRLSTSSNCDASDQSLVRAKAELLPSCTTVWETQSIMTATPAMTSPGYPTTPITPITPQLQTPKRGRRRKTSTGPASSSPVQSVGYPLRVASPSAKTPSAAMHYMNIATSILRTDGSFATVRVIRRKNQRFTAEQIIHVMNMMTNPQDSAMYVGEYHQLKKKIHVFYKCPPENVKPKALQGYGMTWDTYNEQYYKSARPHKNGPIDWQNYLSTVRQCAPFDLPLSDHDEDEDIHNVIGMRPIDDDLDDEMEEDYEQSSRELHSGLFRTNDGITHRTNAGAVPATINVTINNTPSQLYTHHTPHRATIGQSSHEEIIVQDEVIEEVVIDDWNSAT